VSIITAAKPKKGLTNIELDFALEIDSTMFMRPFAVAKLSPQYESGLPALYNEIGEKLSDLEDALDEENTKENLKNVILGLKLIVELDNLKTNYLEKTSSKLYQSISLPDPLTSSLKTKLVFTKLSNTYSKLFTKPSRILGQNFPVLAKVLCHQIPEMFDFNARYYFFKHLQFKPTRAMYFIYQSNKPSFKELPGSKIGKLVRKKLKVNRDKLLEGAKITFSFSHSRSVLTR
jgi:hypothetical protein